MSEEVTDLASPSDVKPKCWRCPKVLGLLLTRPWRLFCPKFHAKNCRGGAVEDGGGDFKPRCAQCNKQLGIYFTRPWNMECPRCALTNSS